MWQRKNAAAVRKENMPVLAHFRFLAHSLTTFGRWGCGERILLSHDGPASMPDGEGREKSGNNSPPET
ncbi:hypothetical protein [Escherichia coli]|uniref:hypothetical protein n=1 Tax=Escherichia coli TaxID=562 RepID=UPI00202CDCA0|nr:hypothetical protein [Escherichia coli]